MSLNFEIITKDFENTLAKYKVACRKDWQFVIRQQSRIVGEKLVRFTPPKTAAIGKRNVARDIGKVFADLSNTKWHDKSLDKMWRAGNFKGVKKALENHPNKLQMPVFKYKRIFVKLVRNIHKAAISRSGRVPKNWRTSYAVAGKGDKHHILDKSLFPKKGKPTINVSKDKHFELQSLLAKATTLQGYLDYEQAVKTECPEIQIAIAQIYWQRIESLHTPWRIRLSVWAKRILRN